MIRTMVAAILMAGLLPTLASPAFAAPKCPVLDLNVTLAKFQAAMQRGGLDAGQRAFGLAYLKSKMRAWSDQPLNANGKDCGRRNIGVHVADCAADGLPELLASTRKPLDEKVKIAGTVATMIGRREATAGELIVVGHVSACQGAALEVFARN